MKKAFKRISALILAVALFSSLTVAFAAEQSSLYLDSYNASLTARTGRKIIINVDVDGTGYMDKIGASSITLFRSSDGVNFSPVATYDSEDYPDLLLGSGYFFDEDVITYYGIAGCQYFAAVTVYAEDSTGSDSRFYDTNVVTCIN